ncbi:MAG TPA: RdgB/HAM1 family non-canonical purine NTP pyrophosphatase [Candidatus Omnitrophota bacterium]|nr:MAG: dITP/XTP pyrophosphatase [Candidatus Omnitrophica bacterium ADurb.Bin314]HOE69041.1 RdgB/HAM1 family non-canonical purine NTP pyrophosphatase [Candidatus Omnitrophota bacterium]HQB93861.1 RdgB/HAM1 family non-canonical purine NTP pyrophosphatase [Candidatus Omnitrophota bacterium]
MKTRKLLVATGNQKKLKELQELLSDLPLELLYLKDFRDLREVPETGATFEENARIKALGYASQAGCLTLADDSGLCVDALDGAPGVLSARFSGHEKDDEANNRKLIELMKNVPDAKRSAHYTAAVALAAPGREIVCVTGDVHGFIGHEPRGSGGFGYDPYFFYPPFGQTFSEIPSARKHEVSHRFKALTQIKAVLEAYLRDSGVRV